MVLVTGAVGYLFSDPTIEQICQTISIGALCATAVDPLRAPRPAGHL